MLNVILENKHILINALLFQILWFVAILGQWYWALIPLALMLTHLFFIRNDLPVNILPLLLLGVIGMTFDRTFNYVGIYQFSEPSPSLPYLNLPIWLATLWLGFCFTLALSLAWLVKKAYVFVLACSLMGPLSYLAGRRLEALSFSDANIWILALEWCVFSVVALIVLLPRLGISLKSAISFKKHALC